MLAEQGWLRLADSYALSERLEHYLLEQDCKLARRREWQPASIAPFDRDIEIAVIKSATPHALAFPCRRILGGWMDADDQRSARGAADPLARMEQPIDRHGWRWSRRAVNGSPPRKRGPGARRRSCERR